jgi:hypothetical protein
LDWVRDRFVLNAFESAEFSVAEEDELTEIRNDRRLKLKNSTDMVPLWFSLQQEYSITNKAIDALLPFSTQYHGAGFSTIYTMKRKNRSRLQALEEDLRVSLSTIRPRTRDIMRHNQAQVSH